MILWNIENLPQVDLPPTPPPAEREEVKPQKSARRQAAYSALVSADAPHPSASESKSLESQRGE